MRVFRSSRTCLAIAALSVLLPGAASSCRGRHDDGTVLTFPGSAVGTEAEILRSQLTAFMAERPDIRVVQQRTPDAADQRHQLYVQWLNARASDPDVLQLDVIWTAEFAAAGWILPLDRFEPDDEAFFPATIAANRWRDRLYAVPWFVDVGMLYWRTDLLDAPPATIEDLAQQAAALVGRDDVAYGFVWQGARYEGLVTVFLEHLGAFGGRILDQRGRVVLDDEPARRALAFMRDAVHRARYVPEAALAWREEQTRFAFQNARAVFMRNWPYAYPLLQDPERSAVAGRFSVAPMPASAAGAPTAALGGSQLAINTNSDHPDEAWALIEFLTRPEQMVERARVAGQYPARSRLYEGDALRGGLPLEPSLARAIIERAVARPVTPIYTELSGVLQVQLHRALTGQTEPREAIATAAREMAALLERGGLATDESDGPQP